MDHAVDTRMLLPDPLQGLSQCHRIASIGLHVFGHRAMGLECGQPGPDLLVQWAPAEPEHLSAVVFDDVTAPDLANTTGPTDDHVHATLAVGRWRLQRQFRHRYQGPGKARV